MAGFASRPSRAAPLTIAPATIQLTCKLDHSMGAGRIFSDKSSLVAFGCFLFQRRLHGAPPLEFWRYLRCS